MKRSGLPILLSVVCLLQFSCKKEALSESKSNVISQPTLKSSNKVLTSGCSSSTKWVHFVIDYNQACFPHYKLTRREVRVCLDNWTEEVVSETTLVDYYACGGEAPALPHEFDVESTLDCSGIIEFDYHNLIYYNASYFNQHTEEAAILEDLNYSVISHRNELNNDELLQYGNDKPMMLHYAMLGWYAAQRLGSLRAQQFASNVPASSAVGICDQVRYKDAFSVGIGGYSNNPNLSMTEVGELFFNEIRARRL